jgi:dihydroxy-acid dehydratase
VWRQFTANTMAAACEFLGIAPMGSVTVPANDPAKAGAARACGRRVMDLLRDDVRPRALLTRQAFETPSPPRSAAAARPTPCSTCSIAREAGVPLTIDHADHEADAAALRPEARRAVRRRRHARAGVTAAARTAPRLDPDCTGMR